MPTAAASGAETPTLSPEPDSPTVLFAFFDFAQAWVEEIAKRKASNPERGRALEEVALKLFQINASDLASLTVAVRSVNRDLELLEQEGLKYKEDMERKKQPPDPAVLLKFEARWQEILTLGRGRLQKDLSPSGWNGVRKYMNDVLRPKIGSVPLG